MRVLVVEDEKKVASFIKRGLEEEAFTVDVAFDGEEGLYLAENNPYDIILMDLMLPKRMVWKSSRNCAPKRWQRLYFA